LTIDLKAQMLNLRRELSPEWRLRIARLDAALDRKTVGHLLGLIPKEGQGELLRV